MRRIFLFIRALCIALVALAGFLKLLDLPAFLASLQTWTLLPGFAIGPVAVLVPFAEIAAAALYFTGRAWAWRLVAGLLLAYSAFYLAHILFAKPPDCTCFGVRWRFLESVRSAWWVMARNLLLLAGVAAPILRARHRRGLAEPHQGLPVRAGFTLVELLVVLLVITLLMTLLLPSIGRAYALSRRTGTLSVLRSHSHVVSAYAIDYRDLAPAITDPEATLTVLRAEGMAFQLRYFDPIWAWPIALAHPYYNTSFSNPIFVDGGAEPSFISTYWYSVAFLADPTFWNPKTRTPSRSQLRATRLSEVLFPDAKATHLASDTWFSGERRAGFWRANAPLAFVDGSASDVENAKLRRGYLNGLGDWLDGLYGGDYPGITTIDGVRGRDRK